MKRFKTALVASLTAFLVLQIIVPDRSNPPIDPALTFGNSSPVPDDILFMVKRACYDCHSNETRWPLHSYVAPISWQVAHDVQTGRHNLNFSNWGSYDPIVAMVLLEHICIATQNKSMPPWPYLLVHRDAKLSDADIDRLCRWTALEIKRLRQ